MGAYADVEKAKASRNIRTGKGKMRNRRYVARKGPLIVFGSDDSAAKAFRNLPGVEVASVDRLNLLQVRYDLYRGLQILDESPPPPSLFLSLHNQYHTQLSSLLRCVRQLPIVRSVFGHRTCGTC